MNSRLINTTPHAVTLVQPDGSKQEYAAFKEFELRLLEVAANADGTAYGVPVHGPPQWMGLSWSQPPAAMGPGNVDLLVSMLVGDYLLTHGVPVAWREAGVGHVYAPDTTGTKAVRNAGGQVVGTRELVRYV